MNYDNAVPKPLKFLISDGKLVDDAGNVIAESDTLKDLYTKWAPEVKKYLLSDGSVVDENNNLIIKNEYYKKMYDQADPKVAKYLHADGTIDENAGGGSAIKNHYFLSGSYGLIANSPDLKNCNVIEPIGSDVIHNTYYGITYSEEKDLFVVVGENGSVLTSSDEKTWTARTSGTSESLQKVVFGKGLFVAVGTTGTILTSADGVTWTSRTSGSTRDLYGLTYSKEKDLFVVVGSAGTIITSPDGTTWTKQTSPSPSALKGVRFCKDSFVAVGNSIVLSSPDGITWTSKTTSVTGVFVDVLYSEEKDLFIIVGTASISTSPDLVNWTVRQNTLSNMIFYGIIFNGTKFIVIGEYLYSTAYTKASIGVIYESENGTSWTSKTYSMMGFTSIIYK